MKIQITKNEKSFLQLKLNSVSLNLSDEIRELENTLNDNLILDNTNPTKEQLRSHREYIKTLKSEIKKAYEDIKYNDSILKKLSEVKQK